MHRTLQQEPEGGQGATDGIPTAVVESGHGLDRDSADRDSIPGIHLHDVAHAAPAQDRSAAPRRDHRALASHLPQRRRIEVVVMRVRHQHRVERRQVLHPGCGTGSPDVADAGSQHGVREHSCPRELQQQRGVPYIRERRVHGGSVERPGLVIVVDPA
jgi:hypothetical protein